MNRRSIMKSLTFLIKPASSLCNMRCRYCFYHDISDIREVKSMGIMTEATAQSLIQAAFTPVEPGGFVQFTFHINLTVMILYCIRNSVQRMWALDTPFRPTVFISMKSGRPF